MKVEVTIKSRKTGRMVGIAQIPCTVEAVFGERADLRPLERIVKLTAGSSDGRYVAGQELRVTARDIIN